MTYLPDVNVWIALVADKHIHHPLAMSWFQSVPNDEFAFCRITELGLLRLLTNVHVMGTDVKDLAGAWKLYDDIRSDSRVLLLSERGTFNDRWNLAKKQMVGGANALTDAYLAVFAEHAGASIVTFDQGFPPLLGTSVVFLTTP